MIKLLLVLAVSGHFYATVVISTLAHKNKYGIRAKVTFVVLFSILPMVLGGVFGRYY